MSVVSTVGGHSRYFSGNPCFLQSNIDYVKAVSCTPTPTCLKKSNTQQKGTHL